MVIEPVVVQDAVMIVIDRNRKDNLRKTIMDFFVQKVFLIISASIVSKTM